MIGQHNLSPLTYTGNRPTAIVSIEKHAGSQLKGGQNRLSQSTANLATTLPSGFGERCRIPPHGRSLTGRGEHSWRNSDQYSQVICVLMFVESGVTVPEKVSWPFAFLYFPVPPTISPVPSNVTSHEPPSFSTRLLLL